MKETKRKRFKRKIPYNPQLILQPRDQELLRAVYEYRFVHSDHILALVPGFEASQQVSLCRRLNKLYRNGYLDRPPQQLAHYKANEKIAYALGDRGADALAQHYGIDRGKISWRKKNMETGDLHIKHALMVSNFRVAMTLAIEKLPEVNLLFWKLSLVKELLDHISVEGEPKPISINPDSFFGLFNGKKEKPKLFYFLEMDRSSMTHDRFLKKLKGYYYYWLHKKCSEQYGIKYFRVLTVTKSIERAKNLRELSRQVDDGRGWPGFLFTAEEMYDVKDPQSVLKKIWQTPADEHLHHLLE